MHNIYNDYYKQLKDIGYDPVPLYPGKKHPGLRGWQDSEFPPSPRWRGWGVCHRTHFIGALDVDITDERLAERVWRWAQRELGVELKRIGKAPKWATLVWNEYGGKVAKSFAGGHKIEFLGDGQQLVFFGVHPDTKQPYEWVEGDPFDPPDLPVIDVDTAEWVINEAQRICGLEPLGPMTRSSSGGSFKAWEEQRSEYIRGNGLRRDVVAEGLGKRGLVVKNKGDGKYELECPWGSEHGTGNKQGAVYYSPVGMHRPRFICLHQTCRSNNRNYEGLIEWLENHR